MLVVLPLLMGAGVYAQEFSSGYSAEVSLPTGMAVSFVSEDARSVEPANSSNIDNLLGVVVGGTGSLLTISSQESNVQVVTSGVTDLLVTDENGEIRDGDYVAISSIEGVGRKSRLSDSRIIGVARGDFSNPTVQTVRTETGETREVAIARIPVLIQVGGNPSVAQEESFLPGFIQDGANALAGEPVAPARIIIAIIIVIGGLVGSTVLLYGAVSSTIISIGRNPLSTASIYAGLARMIAIAVGIILLSVAIAYIVVVGG